MEDRVLVDKPILERFRLDSKTALVTGAGQGIGRAFAHALGEAGAAVAVVDINGDAAASVVAELQHKGIKTLCVVADVTDGMAIQRMVAQVMERWGKLTIAINNAGTGAWADAETMKEEAWRSIMKLNLDAVFLCAQAEAGIMLKAGYGKIINMASMSGHIANTPQNQCAYNTSKAGVIHLTRSLAAEWASQGIRVNSISPGYTSTPLVENMLNTAAGARMKSKWIPLIPMGRFADVTDLQGAAIYLASSASDYMTGHDLVIDGGYCIW